MADRATIGGHRTLALVLSIAAVLLLLVAIGYACLVLLALAAIAPEITIWPLIAALVLGFITATVALVLASRKPRRASGVIVNAVVMTGHLAGLVLVFLPCFLAVEQRYVIPDGYMGEVVIVHGVASGVAEQRMKSGGVSYVIPDTGLLITRGSQLGPGFAISTSTAVGMAR